MPALTTSEHDEFLAQPGILCRIATVTADGAPHVTPVWFIREGEDVFVTPRAQSSWLENVRREPRVALTIDEEAHPYRKVTLEGRARVVHELGEDDRWRDLYGRIATRYVPAESAEAYVRATIDQPRALLAISLADSRVRTWRMPVAGEEYSGIWHQRYYEPGSKLSTR